MAKLLWKPSEKRLKGTNMYRFMNVINERFNQNCTEYAELYQWSVDNIPEFWAVMWDFADIIASKPYDQVVDDLTKMPGAKWFSGARLNFAENLLRYRDDQAALIFKGEGRDSVRMTYAELYDEVARVAKALKKAGVQVGDRVVGFMPNMPQSIIAMLAAASMGAIWSSCSPDFGIKGVLDRFGQIKPKILFTANGYSFKGTSIDSLERIAVILKELPSIEKIIVVPYTAQDPDIRIGLLVRDCNQRALNVLYVWNQLNPENVETISVNCCPSKLKEHADCSYLEPQKSGPYKKKVGVDNNMDLEEVEAYDQQECFTRWIYEFQKCIKCYGCRNICPVCFCKECSLEHGDLINTGDLPPEIPIFHLVRAVHMAGRCIDCGLCEDACPVDIPLRLLYKKVNEIVADVFDYQTGTSPSQSPFNILGDKVTLELKPISKAA